MIFMNFEAYQNTLHKLLTHFCTKSIISENLLSNYLTALIAGELAAGYTILDTLHTSEPVEKIDVVIPAFSINEYTEHADCDYLAPLVEILKIAENELQPFIDGFYLHGSLATVDYVKGWSDVDIFVILSREAITDRNNLLHIRQTFMRIHNLMKKIDILQHHGVMLTSSIDFKSYPENFLPIKVFEKMKMMAGKNNKISGYVRKIPPDFKHMKGVLNFIINTHEKGVFEHHAYNDEYLLSGYTNANNGMYQLKYYLGQFLLLPSLYLTAISESCYKKESFARVQDLFPDIALEWIDQISNVRKTWGEIEGNKYIPNKIPNWVKNMIPSNYFEVGANVASEVLKHIERIENN